MSLTKDKKIWTPGMLRPETKDLPDSGQISLDQIHVEAGGASQSSCGINDDDIRGLINKGSATQMGFNEWHGYKSGPSSSTGFIQGTAPDGGVKSYSLSSLGAQAGDLVIVSTCQDGPGHLTPYNMEGWRQLMPNGYNSSFVQDIYYKVMDSSPEQKFDCTLGSYPFKIPAVAICISDIGALYKGSYQGVSGTSIDPPSLSVASAGSVGIVILCRADSAAGTTTSSGPSGYTKADNSYTSNAGNGYNWKQSVDVFYKLNLPAGTEDPSAISWSQGYSNATATTAIFY